MKRKETYLSRDFRETVALRFPAQAKQLNVAFDMRLSALLAENAGASKEKQYHLKRQILPPCCTYRDFTALFPAFSSNPPGAFSARRRVLPQKSCRPAAASGVWT